MSFFYTRVKSRKIHTKFLILLHFYHQPSVLSLSHWTRYADYCSGRNIKQITRFLCGRPIIRQIRLVAGVLFLLRLYFVHNMLYKSSYKVMALLVLYLWEYFKYFLFILLNTIKINEEWKEKQILNSKKKATCENMIQLEFKSYKLLKVRNFFLIDSIVQYEI